AARPARPVALDRATQPGILHQPGPPRRAAGPPGDCRPVVVVDGAGRLRLAGPAAAPGVREPAAAGALGRPVRAVPAGLRRAPRLPPPLPAHAAPGGGRLPGGRLRGRRARGHAAPQPAPRRPPRSRGIRPPPLSKATVTWSRLGCT